MSLSKEHMRDYNLNDNNNNNDDNNNDDDDDNNNNNKILCKKIKNTKSF